MTSLLISYLKAFLVGGSLCLIGQLLIDFTKLTPARILVSYVVAGVILGVGRAIGETMAVIMVAGNQPVVPGSIFSGVRTMTANIVMEMGYAADLHREALLGTAVVLFVFILIINLCFSMLKRRAD